MRHQGEHFDAGLSRGNVLGFIKLLRGSTLPSAITLFNVRMRSAIQLFVRVLRHVCVAMQWDNVHAIAYWRNVDAV